MEMVVADQLAGMPIGGGGLVRIDLGFSAEQARRYVTGLVGKGRPGDIDGGRKKADG